MRDRVLVGPVLAMLCLATMPGVARADDVPVLPTRQACILTAREAGGVAACIRREDEVRLALGGAWNRYPEYRRHWCLQQLAFQSVSLRSYANLQACLEDKPVS